MGMGIVVCRCIGMAGTALRKLSPVSPNISKTMTPDPSDMLSTMM